jgi:hypothetical protein
MAGYSGPVTFLTLPQELRDWTYDIYLANARKSLHVHAMDGTTSYLLFSREDFHDCVVHLCEAVPQIKEEVLLRLYAGHKYGFMFFNIKDFKAFTKSGWCSKYAPPNLWIELDLSCSKTRNRNVRSVWPYLNRMFKAMEYEDGAKASASKAFNSFLTGREDEDVEVVMHRAEAGEAGGHTTVYAKDWEVLISGMSGGAGFEMLCMGHLCRMKWLMGARGVVRAPTASSAPRIATNGGNNDD